MTSRRQFMFKVVPAVAAASALISKAQAEAPAVAHAEEKDPIAVALGYKLDATKVDAKKYPAYKAGSTCGNCQLFQGKPADAWGVCPLLGGKEASAKGWCQAYVKKA